MKLVILVSSALLALANSSCARQEPRPDRVLNEEDQRRFVFLSVLEGLLEESPDREPLEAATRDINRLFVLKCPICMPVHEAILAYLGSASRVMGPATGAVFPEGLMNGLKSADRIVQLKAVESMVDRYVTRRTERFAMSSGEKAQMKALLEAAKKQGMTLKSQRFGDVCPSCSGATKGWK